MNNNHQWIFKSVPPSNNLTNLEKRSISFLKIGTFLIIFGFAAYIYRKPIEVALNKTKIPIVFKEYTSNIALKAKKLFTRMK